MYIFNPVNHVYIDMTLLTLVGDYPAVSFHLAHSFIIKTIEKGKGFVLALQMDTNRMLEWVKNVKETHGSVEVNALAQVEAINARGLYAVGNYKNTAILKVLGACM